MINIVYRVAGLWCEFGLLYWATAGLRHSIREKNR